MTSSNLQVALTDYSPGSSVFDLPVHQQDGTPVTQSASFSPNSQHTETECKINDLEQKDKDCHSFIVVSGGTGCNSICSAFGENTCYVLPVSDDGGSSSEIIRVLGGPSIGSVTPSSSFFPSPVYELLIKGFNVLQVISDLA